MRSVSEDLLRALARADWHDYEQADKRDGNTPALPLAARDEREPAPSVEPLPLPQKLRKVEEHLRDERDAAVLAELLGDDEDELDREHGARADEFAGRMAPPPIPLHRTQPHLDSQRRELTADLDEGAVWPPIAGPSGLRYRDRSQSADGHGRARDASGSEGGLDDSDSVHGSRSESDAPSTHSNPVSLFSAASSDEDSAASDAEYDAEEVGRGRMRSNPKARLSKPRKRRRKTVKALTQLAAEQANDFLAGIDLPAPEYTPLSVKARLSNILAGQTRSLPPNARVDRIKVREEHPPKADARHGAPGSNSPHEDLRAASEYTGDIDGSDASRAYASGSGLAPMSAAAGGAGRDDDADFGELPDYEEEQEAPEAVLAPKYEDMDLLQEQTYFRAPSREGALSRWVAIVQRNAEPLPEGLDYETYRADCDKLEALGIALPSECFVPCRDFQTRSTGKLLSTRPSAAVCAELWADLLEVSHADRHVPVAGRGRACRCPLWTLAQRRTWQKEVNFLRKRYAVRTEDLLCVLDTVFPRPSTAAAATGSDHSVLQLLYESNWIWYTYIVQLARLRLAYLELASDKRIARLSSVLTAQREEEQIKLKALRNEAVRHHSNDRLTYTRLMLDYNLAESRDRNAYGSSHQSADNC
ncbi:hypothetical protein JCM3774_000239 [Rhodotorula dairenensis]